MIQVPYTNHIGRSSHDKGAKGTNIKSASDLAAAEKHNNHDYNKKDVEKMQSNINLELKQFNKQFDRNLQEVEKLELVKTVKEIYREEFDEAVAEYNLTQKRKDRRIENYYEQVAADQKTDLAVEGLLQIGEKKNWEGKSLEERQKALPIYLDILKEMEKEIPGLKIAGASFHVNEDSPHLHWIGVCVATRKESKKKNGLKKRSCKAEVFTKEILGEVIQTKMRERMEAQSKEIFGWEFEEKKSGRNEDLTKNEYANLKLQKENKELEASKTLLEAELEVLRDKTTLALGEKEKADKTLIEAQNELNKKNEQLQEQQKAFEHNQKVLAKQKEAYHSITAQIDVKKKEVEDWDAELDVIATEKEYIEEANKATSLLQNLQRLWDQLVNRTSPLRDREKEHAFAEAFKPFVSALTEIIANLRRYEIKKAVPEGERLSEPIIEQAKKSLDAQIMSGSERITPSSEPKTNEIGKNDKGRD